MGDENEADVETVRLYLSGGQQTFNLPKKFKMPGRSVLIRRGENGSLVISPAPGASKIIPPKFLPRIEEDAADPPS